MRRKYSVALPTVRVLGTYGVPAGYGGFESAVVNVGGFLRDQGWRVIVYCQLPGLGPVITDEHNGFTRVLIREPRNGVIGRAHYDWVATRHAVRHYVPGEVFLTFGYNTGILSVREALRHVPHVVNMDGMEWQRLRHGRIKQAVLRANESAAGHLANRLVGDHPVIAEYLSRHYKSSRVRMIPYGADAISTASIAPVEELGLHPRTYATVVCRPLPENSILEIVTAWSRRKRDAQLVLLGDYSTHDAFHQAVRSAAGPEVIFAGPIFEPHRVNSLRFHSLLYLHGHTVGGTNPSLVEAMAAGNPILAKDNAYNRWVSGEAALYFSDASHLDSLITEILSNAGTQSALQAAARTRHAGAFTTQLVGAAYQTVLEHCR